MGKDMVAVLSRQLKSYKKPKRQPAKPHLGFANGYEDQIFRALAAVHPKAVRITDAGWRLHADQHIRLGNARCAIHGIAADYRLTRQGVERAVAERLIREPK